MSEVDGQTSLDLAEVSADSVSQVAKMVAPVLRVEELKDTDDSRASSTYSGTTDEEGGASYGEASDHDAGGTENKPPEPEFVPPDDELIEKIVNQVEFYFSDANILKDAFLLKHVRRNKQGYVSLKLITSFKKVKSLTKDYRVVAQSLGESEQLEVNEEGTKVRRKAPLPEHDETTPSRTVVAVNMPFENPTIENVSQLFSKCGDIALIRILRSGKSIPQDIKKHLNRHPEIGSTTCAVIEFELHEAAKQACQMMTDKDDWRSGLRVVLLAAKKENNKKNKKDDNKKEDAKKNSKEEQRDNMCNWREGNSRRDSAGARATLDVSGNSETGEGPSDENEEKEKRKRRKKAGRRKNSRVEELKDHVIPAGCSSGSDVESSDGSTGRPSSGNRNRSPRNSLSPHPDMNKLSPNVTPHSSPNPSPKTSPRTSPTMGRRRGQAPHGRSPLAAELSPGTSPRHSPHGSPEMRRKSDGGSPSSPWVQRRLKAQQENSPLAGTSPGASPRMGRRNPDGSMEGVVRQPRGPDGTRGFASGIGRGAQIAWSMLFHGTT